MGSRTYLPLLVALLHRVCRYITRYRDTLDSFLTTTEQKAALEAVLIACKAFTAIVNIDEGD